MDAGSASDVVHNCGSWLSGLGLPAVGFGSTLPPAMRRRGPSSGPDSEKGIIPSADDEVVRLPVSESGPLEHLDVMPAAPSERVARLQPDQEMDLLEEEGEENLDAVAAELGVAWDSEGGAGEKTTPMGWLALIAILLLIVGGWALAKLGKGSAHYDSEARRVLSERDQEEQELEAARVHYDHVETLAKRYLGAETVEEKASYVRQSERVLPLMQEFYQRRILKPVRLESIKQYRERTVGGYSFFLLEVALIGENLTKFLFVEDCVDGQPRFDWESEVSYQPMEISDYLDQKPVEALDFRVYASLDNFYGYEFADEDRYRCLKITFRDDEEFLFGYILRGSAEERGLTAYLEKGGTKQGQPVLLRLRFLPNTKSRRSVLVEKVVSPYWVLVE